MISFYILSKRLCLKRKGLSDTRVVSITKKEFPFTIYFCKDSKSPQSLHLMNGKCDLLKLSFVWDFQKKKKKEMVYSFV